MELKDMHTRQLMSLLNGMRCCKGDESLELKYNDYTSKEVKAELATREHIPNTAERKKMRQTEAKAKRNR